MAFTTLFLPSCRCRGSKFELIMLFYWLTFNMWKSHLSKGSRGRRFVNNLRVCVCAQTHPIAKGKDFHWVPSWTWVFKSCRRLFKWPITIPINLHTSSGGQRSSQRHERSRRYSHKSHWMVYVASNGGTKREKKRSNGDERGLWSVFECGSFNRLH